MSNGHSDSPKQRTLAAKRDEELVAIYREELMKRNPNLGWNAADESAQMRCRSQTERNPHYAKMFLQTKPSSTSIPRKGVSEPAEIRAIMDIPEVVWLRKYLESSGSTRNGNWGLPVSVLFKMSYFGKPDYSNTRRQFIPGSAIDWAYGHPTGPGTETGEYFALRRITQRHKAGAAIHVNLDLLDQIAALRDPKNGKLLHPNMFKNCSVDGTLIEANVTQSPPYAPTPRQRKIIEREIAGPRRPMVQMVYHGKGAAAEPSEDRPSGGWRKKCFGYNLVVITCMATGLPIIWTLMPATGNERAAVLEILRALYLLKPDFPMEYLVGDGIYGNSFKFIEELQRKYGVHAVFPVNKRMSVRNLDWYDGVPVCDHGLMDLAKTGEFWGPAERKKKGVKPGTYPPGGKGTRPRLRWKCSHGRCKERNTHPTEHRHLYTYLPHAGRSEKAALRSALLARRNNSESLNSQLKHSGPGSDWPGRSRWADDDGMRMGLSLALMQVPARRLVHLTGAYDKVLRDAKDQGFLTTTELRRFELLEKGVPTLDFDGWGDGARAPTTRNVDAGVPIDREYILPSLAEYSDEPDSSSKEGDDFDDDEQLAAA